MCQHYGDYDTMLFVDDVHTNDATDPYLERMKIETGAKYVVMESEMEVLAKHLFEDYGIDEKVGGLRIRTSAGRMTCLAMDYALCIYKYNLGYKKSYICIDKSFENQQRNLHSLLRQLKELWHTPPALAIKTILFDDDHIYLLHTDNNGLIKKDTQDHII